MIRRVATVVYSKDNQTNVLIPAGSCQTCSSVCNRPQEVSLTLPGQFQEQINIDLALRDQLILIFCTFGLPLFGFLLGTLISGYLTEYEPWVVLGAGLGLVFGFKLSPTLKLDRFRISEVVANV